jgi:hypothetical protein
VVCILSILKKGRERRWTLEEEVAAMIEMGGLYDYYYYLLHTAKEHGELKVLSTERGFVGSSF